GSLAEFGADESSAWELDLSGGGDAPIDARFSVDGDAVRVEYAPAEGGDLRITGAGLPIGLLARLIGLALGVDVDSEAFAGRADIDVAVADLEDGLLGTYEVKLSQFAYGS